MEGEAQSGPKRCYYEVMGVDIKASQDDIKRAFKKLSLKNHPDKNRHRQEEAKLAFQEITEAYNCLSDPKERQWYDNNRERLLMNKDDLTREDLELQSYGFDIFSFMQSDAFEGFKDDENGFFNVYGKAFENLNYEEERTFKFKEDANSEFVPLQGFGKQDTKIEEVVKFYEQWQNFTTIKNFAWADKHDAREGENRWEKRQMEQENEKERKKEKKKYIATVKDLVSFVKKLDPRRAQLIELEKQEQEKIQQQRELNKGDKQRKKEQQLREQEEKKKKKEEQEHQKFLEQEKLRLQLIEQKQKLEQEGSKSFVCKVCQKQFSNSTQLGSHKKTHKNTTNDANIDLDNVQDPSQLTKKQQKELKKRELQKKAEETKVKQQTVDETKKKQPKDQKKAEENNAQDEDEEEEKQQDSQGPKKRKRNRNKKKAAQNNEDENDGEEEEKEENVDEQKNVPQQNQQEEEWTDVSGTKKQKKQAAQELKKLKKQVTEKKTDPNKNIEDNFFGSIDENNIKKVGKQQQKKKQSQDEQE